MYAQNAQNHTTQSIVDALQTYYRAKKSVAEAREACEQAQCALIEIAMDLGQREKDARVSAQAYLDGWLASMGHIPPARCIPE